MLFTSYLSLIMLRNPKFCPTAEMLASDGSIKPLFYSSKKKMLQKQLISDDGEVVESKMVEIGVRKPLPLSHFIRLEESSSDYDFENLQKAGIELKPFTGKFVTLGIDTLSQLADTIEDAPAPQPNTINQESKNLDSNESNI